MIQPRERPTRSPIPDRPRKSAQRRHARTRRTRYVAAIRVLGTLTIVVALVMSYLALMANLTSLNYRIGRASEQRAALQEETMRLDDRIAHLESRERLAELAMKMGMQEPHIYAVVSPDDAKPANKTGPGGIALLGSVADWLKGP
jgi:cell division protein FtsL